MIKAMVVDNERWALLDIVHSMPWEKHGFEVVGQTVQSVEALDIARQVHPNVAFLDIRMPVLSGLDLIPLLRKEHPNMLFVLVTGHSEFEYAQAAVKMGVFDYCLKPLEEEVGATLLERIKSHFAMQQNAPPSILSEEIISCDQFSVLLQYVKEHAFEKLCLEDVAKKHFMNPNYCGYLFKLNTNKTFSQFVRDIRITTACYLLQHSKMRVGEIALRVGYENAHYFSRVFSSETGLSPRDYRLQNADCAEAKE